MTSLPPLRLDHIVYAAPDLDRAVEELEERLGVRASAGGEHRGLGTRNALLALSKETYIEVIAPDPSQPAPARARPFGIDALSRPRVANWAVKESQLEQRIAAARSGGFDPGAIVPLSRTTPAGETTSWRLTLRSTSSGDGLLPFLIDWGDAVHPALSATAGCSLLSLRAEHPQPETIQRDLAALGAPLEVVRGPAAALIAQLDTPKGEVELL